MPVHASVTDAETAGSLNEVAKPRPVLRGWLHLGALCVLAVAGPLLVASGRGFGERACLVVYVVALGLLFGVSALFHRVRWGTVGRRRMRRADHSTIFIGIAGTYTAVAGLALTGGARVAILAIVWIGAIAGITLRQVWLDAPKWAVAVPYVVVGWCAVLVLPQLIDSLGVGGVLLLVAGGIAYTAGAVVYALKRPDPVPNVFGYHEVFHLCTVVGATLQFLVVALYALPAAH
jgi:hemolysin III